ncbi:GAF domain-containing sensor histidine kinase [Planomonospora sp. ID82291]|uniref:GAF domain-containing sensor histidine kinase n=1 Tax=Planomonospora sp. ID82291 TaxID=2738136 RepID=UPI0018C41722|nr:GAF domain-containing sensor histidine kinase [Planomonospora sp. ID82291]MBG0817609.1 GAF domain-containing sensor histidine kinase [Planomonospora sp. ID82291]
MTEARDPAEGTERLQEQDRKRLGDTRIATDEQGPGGREGASPPGSAVLMEPDFSALATSAALACKAPIALVSVMGAGDRRLTGRAGAGAEDLDEQALSFFPCTVQDRELLEVPDACGDARFHDDPAVTGEPGVRFYAGVPMIGRSGNVLGVFCVMDHRPRHLSDDQRRILRSLAASATALLKTYRYARQSDHIIYGLQEVQDLKDQFLRTVNHELRTPLTSIRGYLQLVREGGLDEATEHRFLQVIERNSEHILKMIDELLLMSSLNARTAVFTPERVDLVAVVRRVVGDAAAAAESRGHTLRLEAPPSMTAWADARRLQHALDHLLDNAIKYTPDGGMIEVAVTADPARRIRIRDTGIGIAPGEVERIFEDFYRSPQAEEVTGGTGMGLPLVDKIIQLHGGSVRIDSEPGKGTSVRVTLPVPPSDPSPD